MSEFFQRMRASVTVKLLFIGFLPVGDRTEVLLTSAWPSPSFVGAYLPDRRDIDDKGFSAEWKVLHLGRSYPGEWRNGEIPVKRIRSSAFGVNLFVPVSTYQKSTRAAKYAMLIGAVALFIILAAVMYVTRRLDWYRVSLDFGSDWPAPRGGSSQQATPTV